MAKKKQSKVRFKQNQDNAWEKASYYAFHLLAFLLPLTLFPLSYDNYDLPKTVLFRAFVVLIFACWLAGRAFSKRISIRRSNLDILVLIFLCVALVATITSVNLPTSLWGKYERYEGFFTLFSYGVFFFLTFQIFNDTKRIRALGDTIIAATALVSLYGVAQYLSFDFVAWGEQAFEAQRVASTFGNPILLAGYLAMVLPLIIVRFQEDESISRSAFYGFSGLMAFAVLLATFSRGGWIAFLVAVVFLVLTQRKMILSRRILILSFCLFAILLMMGLVGSLSSTARPSNPSLLEKIESSVKTGEGSIATRLLIWKSALKIIRDSPLLGYGPDTFHLTYPPRGSLRYAQLVERWNQPDNAHNYLLQLGSTTGLMGLWAFLSIILFLVWQGTKVVRKKKRKDALLFAGLLAGILAYLVHLQFSINVIDSGATFWLLLGLFYAPDSREADVPRGALVGSALAILFVTLFVLGVSLRFLAADMHFLKAEESASFGALDIAIQEYRRAIELNPSQNLYLISLGNLYAEVSLKERNQKFFSQARNVYLEGERKNPLELDNYVFLGNLFLQTAALDSKYYLSAEKELTKAFKVYPYWADTHALLGKLYFDTDRLRKAEPHYEKVISIDPGDVQSYLYLARIYCKTGRLEAAYGAYNQVLSRDSENLEARRGLEDIARVGGAVTRNP